MGSVPLVLDTDIGTDIDDLLALVVAATLTPDLLLGVSTVAGPVAMRAHIARTTLDWLGAADVPVVMGDAGPATGRAAGHEASWGHEGEGFPPVPTRSGHVRGDEASEALADLVARSPSPVRLCVTGPLCNISNLIRHRPDALQRIDSVHLMGGAFGDSSSSPLHRFPEHNVSFDTAATRALWETSLSVYLYPLDSTVAGARLTAADRASLRRAGLVGQFLDSQLATYTRALRRRLRAQKRSPMHVVAIAHDVLPVAAAANLLTCSYEPMDVDLQVVDGGLATVASPNGRRAMVARPVPHGSVQELLIRCAKISVDRPGP